MRFRDTRPEPDDGSREKRTAGQIMAAAFTLGGAVKLPPGFGGKDPNRRPMRHRYQACLRSVLNDARWDRIKAAAKTDAERESVEARHLAAQVALGSWR